MRRIKLFIGFLLLSILCSITFFSSFRPSKSLAQETPQATFALIDTLDRTRIVYDTEPNELLSVPQDQTIVVQGFFNAVYHALNAGTQYTYEITLNDAVISRLQFAVDSTQDIPCHVVSSANDPQLNGFDAESLSCDFFDDDRQISVNVIFNPSAMNPPANPEAVYQIVLLGPDQLERGPINFAAREGPQEDGSLSFSPNPLIGDDPGTMRYVCSEGNKVVFHWVREGGDKDGDSKEVQSSSGEFIYQWSFSPGSYLLTGTCLEVTTNDQEETEENVISSRSLYFFVDESSNDYNMTATNASGESVSKIAPFEAFSIVITGPLTENVSGGAFGPDDSPCYLLTIYQLDLTAGARKGDAQHHPDGQGDSGCVQQYSKSWEASEWPDTYWFFGRQDSDTFTVSVPGLPQGVYLIDLGKLKTAFGGSADDRNDQLTTLTVFVGIDDTDLLTDIISRPPIQCLIGENLEGTPIDLRGLTGSVRSEQANRIVRCIAVPTAIGDLQVDPVQFVSTVLGFLLSISGGIALILIIRSGYQMMTSAGNPEAIQEARERITSAIVGLLFIIFSLVVLEVIGVDILRLPGFTDNSGTTQDSQDTNAQNAPESDSSLQQNNSQFVQPPIPSPTPFQDRFIPGTPVNPNQDTPNCGEEGNPPCSDGCSSPFQTVINGICRQVGG